MTKVYTVVKHDDGWAYETNGIYSERFQTREAARYAAGLAASIQARPSAATSSAYEDKPRTLVNNGTGHPKASVEG
jgi:hypothetical protein